LISILRRDIATEERLEEEYRIKLVIANEWYQYYTDYQNQFKKLTGGFGCWSLADSYQHATTGNDASDTVLQQGIERILKRAAEAAVKLELKLITKYAVGAVAVTALNAVGYYGGIGLLIIAGTGAQGFCDGLDIGRGLCYFDASNYEARMEEFRELKLNNIRILRKREKEQEDLRNTIGPWIVLRSDLVEELKRCSIRAYPYNASMLNMNFQPIQCGTIKENLKISINKIKKFHSKILRLESDKNIRNEVKNSNQEKIPDLKLEIKKLKGYRDKYYLNKKDNLGYIAIQFKINAYEETILSYQKLSKKINNQRVKYAKELKLANENYILEKQKYRDLTKQLVNCYKN